MTPGGEQGAVQGRGVKKVFIIQKYSLLCFFLRTGGKDSLLLTASVRRTPVGLEKGYSVVGQQGKDAVCRGQLAERRGDQDKRSFHCCVHWFQTGGGGEAGAESFGKQKKSKLETGQGEKARFPPLSALIR